MNVTTIFNATASAAVTSKPVSSDVDGNTTGLAYWELVISATGTIALQGSLDGTNYGALTLPTGAPTTTYTTSQLIVTSKFPYMRAVISANTGTITLLVGVT